MFSHAEQRSDSWSEPLILLQWVLITLEWAISGFTAASTGNLSLRHIAIFGLLIVRSDNWRIRPRIEPLQNEDL
ncbi:hypothetical protein B7486_06240 [cyanobacterium TDX16]|nr:hypothetical protein B7486_06240 [cyanobacterium TDX16]